MWHRKGQEGKELTQRSQSCAEVTEDWVKCKDVESAGKNETALAGRSSNHSDW